MSVFPVSPRIKATAWKWPSGAHRLCPSPFCLTLSLHSLRSSHRGLLAVSQNTPGTLHPGSFVESYSFCFTFPRYHGGSFCPFHIFLLMPSATRCRPTTLFTIATLSHSQHSNFSNPVLLFSFITFKHII